MNDASIASESREAAARLPAQWGSAQGGAALAVVALLLLYVTLGISASLQKSQTGDEGAHLTGGVSYWTRNDYRCQPENGNWPQRWCGLPVWLAGYKFPSIDIPQWRGLNYWDVGDFFIYESGNDADAMLLRGRLMTAILAVVLGVLVYFTSRRLFGTAGGLISLALYALSPTMLTHGFLITSDLAASLFFLAAVLAIWRLLHRVSVGLLLLTWLTLSGLFLSKFSAPIIVPMAALLVAIRLWRGGSLLVAVGRPKEVSGRLPQLAIFLAAAIVVAAGVVFSIWTSYGYRYALINPQIAGPNEAPSWPLVQLESKVLNGGIEFARAHKLLPEGYLYGFAHVMRFSQARAAFLNGEYRTRGWRNFFPYCLAVKTTLELFAVLGLAAGAGWYCGSRADTPTRSTGERLTEGQQATFDPYDLSPLLVLLAVYWMFALTSHLNIGHRHLLPTYPPMMILAGAAGWWLQRPQGERGTASRREMDETGAGNDKLLVSGMRLLVLVMLGLSFCEALWYWPHYLPYFNLLVGGPRHGYEHLVDSSVDWSQDLQNVRRWLDAHPDDERDKQRLYFSFYGSPPPQYYGIHTERLPGFPDRWQPHVPGPLRGGTYIVSATMLQCIMLVDAGRWNKQFEESYRQLQRNVATAESTLATPGGEQRMLAAMPKERWQQMFWAFENLRFSRLASFLRHREPDDEIGYSILVYRLTDAEVAQALNGPPIELLERPEVQIEAQRLGRPIP